MLRQDLTRHLLSCPANVLSCSQEWNRWPLHSRDRWKTVPFRQRNPRALPGQLDYELALRDQKMVGEFYKVPRRTRLALRNNLTRRYPALPVNISRASQPSDKSLSSLKESAKYEVGDENILDKAVYGVAKIFLRNQEQQERRWKEDLDNAIQRTGKPVPKGRILKDTHVNKWRIPFIILIFFIKTHIFFNPSLRGTGSIQNSRRETSTSTVLTVTTGTVISGTE